jgi:MFS family permease
VNYLRRAQWSSPLRAAIAAHVGGLPRAFWIVFFGQIVNRVGEMVLPFLAFYLSFRGLPTDSIGLVMAAVGVGALIGGPMGGALSDRMGPRLTLISGLICTAVSFALLAVSQRILGLVAAAVCVGITGETYRPAARAFIACIVVADQRARAFSLNHWAINLGIAVSGTVASVLVEHGYWLLFAVDATTCVIFAVIIAVGVRRDQPLAKAVEERKSVYRSALADPLLLAMLLLVFLHATVSAQMYVGIPLAIRDDELAPTAYGVIITTNCVLIIVLQPVLTAWLTRFTPLRVLAGAWTTFGVGIALTGLADSTWQYVLTVVVWTLGEIGSVGFAANVIAGMAPAGAHGRYQAMFGWAWSASLLVGPAAGAGLYDTFGPAVLWWSCLGAEAMAGIAAVLLSSAVERRASQRR